MMTRADLVDEIKELQRNDSAFKGAWGKYCDERLGGLRDPNRHEANALQTFLTLYHQGSLEPPPPQQSGVSNAGQFWPSGTEPPKKPVQSPMGMLLVERIKALQRTDDKAKQAWWKYCDMHLAGKKDPTLQDETVLQNFLTSYNMGTLSGDADLAAVNDGNESQPDLVRKVKYLQRSDANAKQAWWDYCENYLNGKKDPNTHEAWQLRDFITKFKDGSLGVEANGAARSGESQEALVQKVKGLQRSDVNAKEAWHRFCGGVRDPSRHTAAFLEKFVLSMDPANQQAQQAQQAQQFQAAAPLPAFDVMQHAIAMAAIGDEQPLPPPEPAQPAQALVAEAPQPAQQPCEAQPLTPPEEPSWGGVTGTPVGVGLLTGGGMAGPSGLPGVGLLTGGGMAGPSGLQSAPGQAGAVGLAEQWTPVGAGALPGVGMMADAGAMAGGCAMAGAGDMAGPGPMGAGAQGAAPSADHWAAAGWTPGAATSAEQAGSAGAGAQGAAATADHWAAAGWTPAPAAQWTPAAGRWPPAEPEPEAAAPQVNQEVQQRCEDFLRHGSELSTSFQQAWDAYRSANSEGLTNPVRYQAVVTEFAEYSGKCMLADFESRNAPPHLAEASRKRPGGWPAPGEPPALRPRFKGGFGEPLAAQPQPNGGGFGTANGGGFGATSGGFGAANGGFGGANGSFSSAAGARLPTVAVKKSITDQVRRINSMRCLREEIKLGRVAGSLARLDERAALQVLAMLESMSWVEDPNEFVIAQASMMIEAGSS